MNRFCLALLFAGIGVVVSNAFDEKIIFPDLFAFSASNEPLTWIEAIQVKKDLRRQVANMELFS